MRASRYWIVYLLLSLLSSRAVAFAEDSVHIIQNKNPDLRAYSLLHLPANNKFSPQKQLVVAVVDDGFSFTHKSIKDYFYVNTKEIANNGIDDNANGYIDDVTGWDVADNDNNVALPEGRESVFYHGTMVMGVIAQVAEQCFGAKAPQYVKILPVKAIADKAQRTTLENGYDGIAYAVHQEGVDMIVCAWSGGKYDREKYQSIFDDAAKKGITIIGSAGNFYSEQVDPPASISSVYAIAALDSTLRKLTTSNYSQKIDLVASGELVYAPHPFKDNTYFYAGGTSSATALVGGCAAVLKVAYPAATPKELFAALKNTAQPVDSLNRYYGGKLGAGMPDLTAALTYLGMKTGRDIFFNSKKSVGDIIIDKSVQRPYWEVKPEGGYHRLKFTLSKKSSSAKDRIDFYTKDSLYASYPLKNFPIAVPIPGGYARVVYSGKKTAEPVILSYSSDPIDSTTLYCKDTKYIENTSGVIADGSGNADYTNNCSCKWQLTMPAGKKIRIDFDEFDTEANMDYVWIFNGDGTLQENLIAKFSGPKLPPIITTASSQILIWFLTDKQTTGKGWRFYYAAVDDEPGVQPREPK